jgi:hypothetical protein
MNKISKALYVAALALSAIAFTPRTASAQEMRGSFTLKNEVRWQNTVIPAGEYKFVMKASSPASILTLSKISGEQEGYMLLVNDASPSAATVSASRLVLVSRADGKFVSAMELPEYGTTLHFNVPTETAAKVAVSKEAAATIATR